MSFHVEMAFLISHGSIDLLRLSGGVYHCQFHYDKHSSASYGLQIKLICQFIWGMHFVEHRVLGLDLYFLTTLWESVFLV